MAIRISFHKQQLHFAFEAKTSRGVMRDKHSWFLKMIDTNLPEVTGIGECSPLAGLSIDDRPDYEDQLKSTIARIESLHISPAQLMVELNDLVSKQFPSLVFGMETALLDLHHGGRRMIYKNDFIQGVPIPINGLIWMGDFNFMMEQIAVKVAQGFKCLKLKIGGLQFDSECEILDQLRKKFGPELTIRLDANGSFGDDEAFTLLQRLAAFDIHSIEQPVLPGSAAMPLLCNESPIPIALDEELIPYQSRELKEALLNKLRPQFIILKPSLHGGMLGCREWIALASNLGIGWWITSALESNIGLNAICQFAAEFPVTLPHGLGTGAIYSNNIASPLMVNQGSIFYNNNLPWGSANLF